MSGSGGRSDGQALAIGVGADDAGAGGASTGGGVGAVRCGSTPKVARDSSTGPRKINAIAAAPAMSMTPTTSDKGTRLRGDGGGGSRLWRDFLLINNCRGAGR